MGFNPQYDLDSMTKLMLKAIKRKDQLAKVKYIIVFLNFLKLIE